MSPPAEDDPGDEDPALQDTHQLLGEGPAVVYAAHEAARAALGARHREDERRQTLEMEAVGECWQSSDALLSRVCHACSMCNLILPCRHALRACHTYECKSLLPCNVMHATPSCCNAAPHVHAS